MHHPSDWAVRRGRGIILALATCSLLAGVATATAADAEAPAAPVSLGQMQVRPTSGPGGTRIDVRAKGLSTQGVCQRVLEFSDAAGTVTGLGNLPFSESFRTSATIPANAAAGLGTVYVHTEVWMDGGLYCDPPLLDDIPRAPFTVIGGPRRVGMSSAHIQVQPTSGPPGIRIGVAATGLPIGPIICYRELTFTDSAGAVTGLEFPPVTESFKTSATIPASAAPGPGSIHIIDHHGFGGYDCRHVNPFPFVAASAPFTVT